MKMRRLTLVVLIGMGLLVACGGGNGLPAQRDLPSRLTAANLLAGSLAAGLAQATSAGIIAPDSDGAEALMITLAAVEMALDGAGGAWRAGLPDLAESNLGAAEQQMSGLRLVGLEPQLLNHGVLKPEGGE